MVRELAKESVGDELRLKVGFISADNDDNFVEDLGVSNGFLLNSQFITFDEGVFPPFKDVLDLMLLLIFSISMMD